MQLKPQCTLPYSKHLVTPTHLDAVNCWLYTPFFLLQLHSNSQVTSLTAQVQMKHILHFAARTTTAAFYYSSSGEGKVKEKSINE